MALELRPRPRNQTVLLDMLFFRLQSFLFLICQIAVMALTSKQPDLKKLRLGAELAKFAYASTDPEKQISVNNTLAQQSLCEVLGSRPETVLNFKRYHSRPWFTSDERKFRWFRSYSYFAHLRTPENVDRIIVGFRGTWLNSEGNGTWYSDQSKSAVLSLEC